ncbi:hypothetical protein [Nostoc sp.]
MKVIRKTVIENIVFRLAMRKPPLRDRLIFMLIIHLYAEISVQSLV